MRTVRTARWTDAASGLRAFLVIDDDSLGPAAGGIRTRRYASDAEAIADAASLARAMTLKCALAGLDAGGAKVAVIDHDGLDRSAAFAELGRRVEALGGAFRTAGDLGTTAADLEVMGRHTRYVHLDERGLLEAAGRGLLRCVEACAATRLGSPALAGLRVAVQGAGAIGAAAARALGAAGAAVILADLDPERAAAVAFEIGARVVAPEEILEVECDVLAPCAVGRVIDRDVAGRIRAWAVCGAANDILTDDDAAEALAARGILHVPDPIASAGAVIEGIGRSVMGLDDRTPLIDRLGITAREVLAEAHARGETPTAIALERADAIRERRGTRPSGSPAPTAPATSPPASPDGSGTAR